MKTKGGSLHLIIWWSRRQQRWSPGILHVPQLERTPHQRFSLQCNYCWVLRPPWTCLCWRTAHESATVSHRCNLWCSPELWQWRKQLWIPWLFWVPDKWLPANYIPVLISRGLKRRAYVWGWLWTEGSNGYTSLWLKNLCWHWRRRSDCNGHSPGFHKAFCICPWHCGSWIVFFVMHWRYSRISNGGFLFL